MAGEKSIMYDPILGQFRRRDKGGGSDFDPNGIYPGLTAGGLIAREEDALPVATNLFPTERLKSVRYTVM